MAERLSNQEFLNYLEQLKNDIFRYSNLESLSLDDLKEKEFLGKRIIYIFDFLKTGEIRVIENFTEKEINRLDKIVSRFHGNSRVEINISIDEEFASLRFRR